MKLFFILTSASGRGVGGVKGSFWRFGRTLITPPTPPTYHHIDADSDDEDDNNNYIDAWVDDDDDDTDIEFVAHHRLHIRFHKV